MKQFISKDSETGVYYLYFKGGDGKRKRLSLRTLDYAEALAKAELPQTVVNPTTTPLDKFLVIVLNYVEHNFCKGTYDIYETALTYFKNFYGNRDIKDVTINDLESFKVDRLQYVKIPTVNNYIRIIKASFNLAVKLNIVTNNPAKDFKKIKEDQKEKETFTEEQFNKLIAVIDKRSIKEICYFGYYTGARISEILNLQWNDIDLDNRIITVRNKTGFRTKTGRIRRIPISERLFAIINEIPMTTPDGYLFLTPTGNKFTKDYASGLVTKYIRKAGLPRHLHFHCLRHTAITRMITKGVPIAAVQRIAGHSNIQTTLGYTHLLVEDLRNAVNCL